MDLQNILDIIKSQIALYAPKVVLALIVLFVGLRLIKLTLNITSKAFEKKDVEKSLRGFLLSFISISLKVLLIISVASMLGIATTSFIAVLGAAGLAVGLALQGSLANLAGGVLIILFKPFKVGDLIECQGEKGVVQDIQIFCTTLNTADNVRIILPNGPVASSSMKNFSANSLRRVDFSFGIGYEDNFKAASKIISDLASAHSKVLNDPAPFIRLGELADSSVNITTRLWVKAEDYWDVHFDMLESVKAKFDEEGISIPYPQQDIHLKGVLTDIKSTLLGKDINA